MNKLVPDTALDFAECDLIIVVESEALAGQDDVRYTLDSAHSSGSPCSKGMRAEQRLIPPKHLKYCQPHRLAEAYLSSQQESSSAVASDMHGFQNFKNG